MPQQIPKDAIPIGVSIALVVNCRSTLDWRTLPDVPAIYIAVHHKYGIFYIGKTRSLKKRFKRGQHGDIKMFGEARIAWVKLDFEFQHETELYLIHKHQPDFNVAANPKYRRRRQLLGVPSSANW